MEEIDATKEAQTRVAKMEGVVKSKWWRFSRGTLYNKLKLSHYKTQR
jgi:hypothetical protein